MTSERLALQAHLSTPCHAVQQLQVISSMTPAPGAWHLRYELTAERAQLRVPASSAKPGPVDGLWRHTCFEAFVGNADGTGYHEFNLSPSGDWAIYVFTDERLPSRDQAQWRVSSIVSHHDADRLILDAWLSPDFQQTAGAPWLLGLSAVIETSDDKLSYWALEHPAPEPDFHHRSGWTARLSFLAQHEIRS